MKRITLDSQETLPILPILTRHACGVRWNRYNRTCVGMTDATGRNSCGPAVWLGVFLESGHHGLVGGEQLRKYWSIFKVALSERFVYRTDFFLGTLLRFSPIITTIALWRAVYRGGGRELIGGLTYHEVVAYYLIVMIVRSFGSMPGLSSTIATDVREGELRRFLIQPVNYIVYLLHLRAAHKCVFFAVAAVPYVVVFWFFRSYLPAPPDPSLWPACGCTLMFCFILGYLINTAVGLLTFWFLEVTSFLFLFMVSQYFLSGHQFPLTMLPEGFGRAIIHLPFAYETFHPVMLLLGKLDHAGAMRVLAGQLAWIVVMLIIVTLAWRRGLRRYAAFGG